MSLEDKDIKQLFQDKLGNHEMPVNPEIWAGVQSGIGGSAAGGTAVAGSAMIKFIAAAAIVAGVATGTYLLWPESKSEEVVTELKEEVPIAQEKELEEKDQELETAEETELQDEPRIAQKQEKKEEETEAETAQEVDPVQDEIGEENSSEDELTGSEPVTEKPNNIAQETAEDNDEEDQEPAEENFEAPTYSFAVTADPNDPMAISYDLGTYETTVKWDFGDGYTSAKASGTYIFEEEGIYTVTVESTDAAGNISRFEEEIQAYHDPVLSLPNVFSPGTTPGSNDYYDIDKFASKHIATYTIRIYSADGKELIFESDENNPVWDGNDKFGNPMPEAWYLAIVHAENAIGKSVDESERVLLKR